MCENEPVLQTQAKFYYTLRKMQWSLEAHRYTNLAFSFNYEN